MSCKKERDQHLITLTPVTHNLSSNKGLTSSKGEDVEVTLLGQVVKEKEHNFLGIG